MSNRTAPDLPNRASTSTDRVAKHVAKLAANQKLCCGLVSCNLRRYTIKFQIMTGILTISLFILFGLCTVCIGNIFTLGARTKTEAIYGLTEQITTNALNFSEANAAEVSRNFARREAATRAMAIAVSNFHQLNRLTYGEGTASLFHEDTPSAPGAVPVSQSTVRYDTKLSSSYYFPKTRKVQDPNGCYLPNGDKLSSLGENMNVKRCFDVDTILSDPAKKKEVDRSVMLDPYFIKYYSDIKGIDQIYIGYEYSGLFRQYPGNNANQDYEYPKQNTYDPRKRPWYIDAKAATKETIQGRSYGETIISSPYKGYSLGIWMVTFAKAIYQGTSLLGVIGIDISIDNLQKKMLGVHFLETGFVGLAESKPRSNCDFNRVPKDCKVHVVAYPQFEEHVDSSGEVTTASVGLTEFIDDDTEYLKIFGEKSGIQNHTHLDKTYIVAHSMVRSPTYVQKYIVLIVIPEDEALEAVPSMEEKIASTEVEISSTVLVVTVITGAVVSFIVWSVTDNLSTPVSAMVKIANSVVKGAAEQDYTKDFTKRQKDMRKVKAYAQMQTGERAAVDSRNEMVSLARSFLTMISGLKRDADRKTQHVLQPMNSYHGSKENDFVTVFDEEDL
jgi:hypothetical protein